MAAAPDIEVSTDAVAEQLRSAIIGLKHSWKEPDLSHLVNEIGPALLCLEKELILDEKEFHENKFGQICKKINKVCRELSSLSIPDLVPESGFNPNGSSPIYQDETCRRNELADELQNIDRELDALTTKNVDEVWKVQRETPFVWRIPSLQNSLTMNRKYDASSKCSSKTILTYAKTSRRISSKPEQIEAPLISVRPIICVKETSWSYIHKEYKQFNSVWKGGDLVLYRLPFASLKKYVEQCGLVTIDMINDDKFCCSKQVIILSTKMQRIIGIQFANFSSLEQSQENCLMNIQMFDNACRIISSKFNSFKKVPIVVCQDQGSAELASNSLGPALFISHDEFIFWRERLTYDGGSTLLKEADYFAFKKVCETICSFLTKLSQHGDEKFIWQM